MNDFLTKLSIYDQLGYLVVGGLLYICILYDQSYLGLDLSKVASNPFGVAVIVYFLGHVGQIFAREMIKPKPYEISDGILMEISKAIGDPYLEKHQAFDICFLYALSVDKTGRVETMNARYSLYRGWAFVLAFQAVFCLCIFLYCLSKNTPDDSLLTSCLGAAFLAWITANRAAHFYEAIAHRTVHTFLLTKLGSLLPAAK